MPKLPTIYTAEKLTDRVPESLPLTCLRKTGQGFWRLKTATEHGVKQTDYKDLDDIEAIGKALLAWRSLHPMIVGPIVICFDSESYYGLEPVLVRVFPEGRIQKGLNEIAFPWSTEPKH